MTVEQMRRRSFLRMGAVGMAGAIGGGGLAAGPASGALPVATPKGDDVGFLAFAVVAEQTSADWYEQALRVRGFSRGERRRLQAAARAKSAHAGRMNAVLGPEAVANDDFVADFPAAALRTRPRALALGERLEGLLVGVLLNGGAFATDGATRLLLGRMLAYDAQQLAWLRGLAGGPAATGLPIPLDLEQAGTQLDGLLATPSFSS